MRYYEHLIENEAIADQAQRANRLVELNVIRGVHDLCATSILQQSWQRRGGPSVHGWVYDVNNGPLQDLEVAMDNSRSLQRIYQFDAGHAE